ncbi:hypothetical protein [Paenibacillus sp.]|uniref:phosphotriesterase family protein n=1 Tax=Paenibacillus sp. TaxID=58172 RepID=UPI002D6EBF91|nr:hypothetical protein [Paenibacillus sp.]HZG86614.1 hypothetical protein [Paenibacillus sp.]
MAASRAIRTVRGPVEPERFGFCHSHEHLFLANGHPATLNPALRIDDYELTLEELRSFRAAGGRAIVDAQPLGCGRMEAELVRVSQEADVHVVASTGFHKLAFYKENHWIRRLSADALRDVFVHELRHGLFVGTDSAEPDASATVAAKAGQIKTAVDAERMADADKRWFEAAAAASLATGAPIMCHTESVEQGEWLVEFYLSRGVPPERIIVCHLDRALERPESHRRLAARGVYLEYDTIGRFKYHSDEAEARWIADMLAGEFADRLLLGLDTTRARLRSYGGEIGLTHMIDVFLPLLRTYGVEEAHIAQMMVVNPANAFAMPT